MSSSGLIYVAIVGAWAAYLVPRCLKRSDEFLVRRYAERSAGSSRVLERRSKRGRDEAHYSLLRLPPAVRPAPVVKKRRDVRPAHPAAYGPPYRPVPRQAAPLSERARSRPVGAATLARRRRVLLCLAVWSLLGAAVWVAGWVPGWVGVLPVLLLLTYLAELRAQQRRQRAVGLRQRRVAAVAQARRRRLDLAARLDAVRRVLRPTPESAVPVNDPPVEVHDGWQPVPVPLPTYVTAPRAPIRTRTIDVSAEGAWTGTLSTDDTAEIPVITAPIAEPDWPAAPSEPAAPSGPAAPAGPTDEPVERRAVND